MRSNACATRQVFSIESTGSALMSVDVLAIETIYNFCRRITLTNNVQNPVKSEKSQAEENT